MPLFKRVSDSLKALCRSQSGVGQVTLYVKGHKVSDHYDVSGRTILPPRAANA